MVFEIKYEKKVFVIDINWSELNNDDIVFITNKENSDVNICRVSEVKNKIILGKVISYK